MEELKILTCFLKEKSRDRNEPLYKVLERVVGVKKIKRLVVDKSLGYAKCSYKEMEFRQVPCRHILAYLRMKQIEWLLEYCIQKVTSNHQIRHCAGHRRERNGQRRRQFYRVEKG